MRALVASFALILAAGRCVGSTGPTPDGDPEPDPAATTRILFVGNSLTYVNDLPGMVKALSDSAHLSGVQTAQIAKPDYALEDHWADGQAARVINRSGWHVVIMQQGPSSRPENRANLREWAARFADLIRGKGGVPAMYSVWPAEVNSADFAAAAESYRLASVDINGPLFQVANAWQAAWRRDSGLPLYSGDGLHASVQGTYLAAITIFGQLNHRSVLGSPNGLTMAGGAFQLSTAQARVLQQAADEVNGF